MLENDAVIAVHNRLFGSEQYSLQILHYLEVLNRKPGSIRHSKLLRSQDRIIQDLFDHHYNSHPKEFLQVLGLIRESSSEMLCRAIQACASRDIIPTPEMLKLFIIEPKTQVTEQEAWKDYEFNVPEADLSIFDEKLN